MRPYVEWEDWQAGMWSPAARGKPEEAAALLADPMRLHAAMRKVVSEWPVCTEVNLHEPPNNRAWIGQAACCIEVGANEEATREAWGMISDEQRAAANKVADSVIEEWKFRTKRNPQMELFWNA